MQGERPKNTQSQVCWIIQICKIISGFEKKISD